MSDSAVRSWAVDAVESGALEQAQHTARARGVVPPVAIMPDAHVGIGACIGSVVVTDGTIIPAAVGVDIGCGISGDRLDITAEQLPDDLGPVLAEFSRAVPVMSFDRHRRHRAPTRERARSWLDENPVPSDKSLTGLAAAQIGTLGRGNHFLELSHGADGHVWLVVHSGSRGPGNRLATAHIKTAEALDSGAPRDLASLSAGAPEFDAYVADMRWCQQFAYVSRDAILDAARRALQKKTCLRAKVTERIRCHHNYAETEAVGGADRWVTRKGAIRARRGDKGIIAGSMGTSTFVVEGLGNPDSYQSAAHGAGRDKSRRQAREQGDVEEFKKAMTGRVWQEAQAGKLLDEAPSAYKDIHSVMALQSDLCRVADELTALVNYKGT